MVIVEVLQAKATLVILTVKMSANRTCFISDPTTTNHLAVVALNTAIRRINWTRSYGLTDSEQ
jgi:hypothetical protein